MIYYNYKKVLPVLLAFIVLSLYSFTSPAGNEYINLNHTQSAIVIDDSAQVVKTIQSFLKWYKKNLNKANSFSLLTKDNKGFYIVNKKACIDYQDYLKSSHFISAKYTSYWQTFFNDKAAMLKKEKIRSDIPEGFDMDLVLITQEPEIILENIKDLQFHVASLENNEAIINMALASDRPVEYKFELRKVQGKWLIDYISTPNFD